ncbi:winged helix-turn-helix domain-containing protein [Janibacter terrae]|uniref:winged helix-turn-helix domain-containing protein n=1 Tax=Janibacter terrae TaxID=103817 RepID=UPI0031F7FA39
MRSVAPPLLPILRSHTQGKVLAAVLLHPDREVTQTELARAAGIPQSTASGEVARLVEAGVFISRRVGRATLLRANPRGRLTSTLTQLVAMTYGPLEVVAEEFAGLGAVAVVLYGSWAARWHGRTGKEPGDVDVLVLGDVDRAAVYDAAGRVEERVGFEVNPVIRPASSWADSGADPLVDDVRRKPYVVALGHVDEPAQVA